MTGCVLTGSCVKAVTVPGTITIISHAKFPTNSDIMRRLQDKPEAWERLKETEPGNDFVWNSPDEGASGDKEQP